MAKKKSTKLGGNDMKSAKKHVPGKITIAAIVFDQGGCLGNVRSKTMWTILSVRPAHPVISPAPSTLKRNQTH